MRAAVGAVVDVAAPKQAVVFAVRRDDTVLAGGKPHRRFHHRIGLDPGPVVGKSDDAALQRAHIHQLLSPAPEGYRSIGEYVDAGVPPDNRQFLLQMLGRVGDGIEVGHRADGGVAAPRRRLRPRADGLLIRRAGFAQVDVYISKTEGNEFSFGFDDGRSLGGFDGGGYFGNTAVPDENIGPLQCTLQ